MGLRNIIDSALGQQLLFKLASANMQSTADQQFAKIFDGSTYFVTSILARQRSGGASVTCAGGIYDAVSKGGNAIVATAQSWVTLSSTVMIPATLATMTALLSATPYLSLTTGSTAACTADLYIFGMDIS